MTNYHSQLVNHPHPGVVCCDTNSSSKLSHREDDICKGLGYILSMQGAFFCIPQPATPTLLCVLKMVEYSLTGLRSCFSQKEAGLVIMMSRYHSFTLECADTLLCMQTNTADDYIHNYKSAFYLYPPSLYFGKMSASRLLLAHRLNRKDLFGVKHIACCERAVTNDLLM